jgi:hypothetical protein
VKRALVLCVPVALALTLVACGDDDDDEPDETASDVTGGPSATVPDLTEPDFSVPNLSDISIPNITIPDLSLPENAEELIGQVFPGLDDDQVSCLAENLEGDFDVSAALDLMDECNINPSDLTPGG